MKYASPGNIQPKSPQSSKPKLTENPAPPAASARSRLPQMLFMAFCFVFPIVYHLWPILGQLNRSVLNTFIDNAPNLWSLWHVSESAALHGESLYFTTKLMAPVGANLTYHTLCLLPCFLVSPLVKLVGLYFAFNVLIMLGILCAGLGPYLLVNHLVRSRGAASFAALVAEMSPVLFYRLMNHFSLAFMGLICVNMYLVLTLLCGRNTGDKLRRSLWLALGLFATFLTDYNLFIYSVFCMGLLYVVFLLSQPFWRRAGWRKIMRERLPVALMSGAFFALLFYAWACATPFQDARFWQDNYTPPIAFYMRSDAAFYLIPHPWLWIWGERLQAVLNLKSLPSLEQSSYLGFAVIALGLIGIYHLYRKIRNVSALAGLALIMLLSLNLSLGKELMIFGEPSHFKGLNGLLLYNYLDHFPLLNNSRVPGRWSIVCFLALTVFAGCGFHYLLQIRRPRLKYFCIGLIMTLLLVEYAHVPSKISSFPRPKVYEQIGRADRPSETIVEVPIGFMDGMKTYANTMSNVGRMVWATDHHYRIVSCYVSRIGNPRLANLVNQPFLRDIWLRQGNEQNLVPAYVPTAPEDVKNWIALNDVAYVIVKRDGNSTAVEQYIESTGLFSRVFLDQEYSLFKLRG